MRLPVVVQNPYTETPRLHRNAALSCCRALYVRWLARKRTVNVLLGVGMVLTLWYRATRTPGFIFHSDWHPRDRKDRFPSVQDRVRIYMSNWCLPMCRTNNNDANSKDRPQVYRLTKPQEWPRIRIVTSKNQSKEYDNIVTPDKPFLLVDETIQDCARNPYQVFLSSLWKGNASERIQRRRNMRPYCQDALELLELFHPRNSLQDVSNGNQQFIPLVGQFCDEDADSFPIPLFAKFRHAAVMSAISNDNSNEPPRDEDACVASWHDRTPLQTKHQEQYLSPIIWKLGSSRHWEPVEPSRKVDIAWKDKVHGAIWRGALTGPIQGDSEEDKCRNNARCAFVLHHVDSPSIDAGLTKNAMDHVPSMEKFVTKQAVSMKKLQSYKVLIILEGNDVASGLKWALMSQSVVLMPPPTKTSWAMEELLEPWVHYIPLYPNGTNAEEMVQWVKTNDNKAQRIAERATLFMYDMLYHPEAAKDELEVKKEIVKRYKDLWLGNPLSYLKER